MHKHQMKFRIMVGSSQVGIIEAASRAQAENKLLKKKKSGIDPLATLEEVLIKDTQ